MKEGTHRTLSITNNAYQKLKNKNKNKYETGGGVDYYFNFLT